MIKMQLEHWKKVAILQAEIAHQRQIQKDELERRAKVRDAIILWTVLPAILIIGAGLLYLFVTFLKGQQ